MTPEKLIIQGLYSYQEQQVIDFKPLTEAKLFGIFGHVGSGKSSILEAIMFALYGQTDRIGGNQNRNYNMMNLRSDQLLIDFTFEVKGEKYRAKVKSRRNSKRFEDVKTYDRTLYSFRNGEWTPITQQEFEEIIGLDYKNFKRTVIIPQGKFQDFITLSPGDRTKMIKDLFSLEKFELWDRTSRLATACKDEVNHLKGQLEELKVPTKEEIDQLALQINQITKEIEIGTKSIEQKTTSVNNLNNLKELVNQNKEQQEKLKRLNEQENFILQKKEFIKDFETCSKDFEKYISESKRIESEIKKIQTQIESDSKHLNKLSKEKDVFSKKFNAVREVWEQKDQLNNEAQAIEAFLEINSLKTLIKNESDRVVNGKNTIIEHEKILQDITLNSVRIQNEIKELKQHIPDQNTINNAMDWHNNLAQLNAKLQPLVSLQESYQNEIEQKTQTIKDSVKGDADCEPLEFLNQQLQDAQSTLESVVDKHQHLIAQKKIGELSGNLENGEPCPVCGSLSHPQVMDMPDIESQLAAIITDVAKAKTRVSDIQNQISSIKAEYQVINSLENKNIKNSQDIDIIKTDISRHMESFRFQGYESLEKVKAASQKLQQQRDRIDKLNEELSILNNTKEAETADINKWREAIHKIETGITQHKTKSSLLLSQHEKYFKDYFYKMDDDELKNHYAAILKKTTGIEESYEAGIKTLESLSSDIDKLTGRITIEKQRLQNTITDQESLSSEIEKALLESKFNNIDEIRDILRKSEQHKQYKTDTEQYANEMLVVQTKLKTLAESISGREYSQEAHQEALNELNADKEKNAKFQITLGELKNTQNNHNKNLKQAEKLSSILNEKEKRLENLNTMKSLFRSSGFVNYISTVYLSQLVDQANERFRLLTRQQLKLELSSSNEFMVRDFMNGGNIRSVKTLSGGQTFQCALSLALALSDSVQVRNNAEHNFFFLDEGFGSLDREALDIVFKTLKDLQKENRIVGIISHVEDMQQEVEINLNIYNDPERGSIIIRSWEK